MLCPHCGEKIERKKHTEYEGARDENWFTPKWDF